VLDVAATICDMALKAWYWLLRLNGEDCGCVSLRIVRLCLVLGLGLGISRDRRTGVLAPRIRSPYNDGSMESLSILDKISQKTMSIRIDD